MEIDYIKFLTVDYLYPERTRIEIYNEENAEKRVEKAVNNTEKITIVHINNEEFNKLVNELKSYGIEEWREKYIDPGVNDGMGWRLEYNVQGNLKIIDGENKYPDNWKEVVKAILDLTK